MFHHFQGFFIAMAKNRYRDKAALFWSFAFPFMFLIIFGAVFGTGDTTRDPDQIKTQLTNIGVFFSDSIPIETENKLIDLMKLMHLTPFRAYSLADLEKGVEDSADGIRFGLAIEGEATSLEITTILNAGRENQNPLYQSLSSTFSQKAKTYLIGFRDIMTTRPEQVSLTGESISQFGYILAGVLAVSISMSGVTSLIVSLGYFRKNKILKRIIATPARAGAFIAADMVNTIILSAISSIGILILSNLMYGIRFQIHPLYFPVAFLASTLLMVSFGGLFLLLFREPNAASNAVNIVTNVMIFFSGVYVPLEFLPEWLKGFANVLPLYHIARTMRFSLGQDLMAIGEYWGIIFAFLGISLLFIPFVGRSIFNMERK